MLTESFIWERETFYSESTLLISTPSGTFNSWSFRLADQTAKFELDLLTVGRTNV
eukprot:XP_764087.1 hypothetical protein [Theileria parva strain Muguga]